MKIEFMPTKEILSMAGDHQAVGKRMDLMASFTVKGDGKWCLTHIEDSPMPGYKDGDDDEQKPEDQSSKFMETYEKARAGQMEGGATEGSEY